MEFIRNGYMYIFKKTLANDFLCWEFILRRKRNQEITIKILPIDEFIEQVNKYIYTLTQIQVEVTKVKTNVKRKAEN